MYHAVEILTNVSQSSLLAADTDIDTDTDTHTHRHRDRQTHTETHVGHLLRAAGGRFAFGPGRPGPSRRLRRRRLEKRKDTAIHCRVGLAAAEARAEHAEASAAQLREEKAAAEARAAHAEASAVQLQEVNAAAEARAARLQISRSDGPEGNPDTYFLGVDEKAEIIGASIQAAGISLEQAFGLIRSKLPPVKAEVGDNGEPLAASPEPERWRMEALPVSKLKYTQKSIKREFQDGRQFNKLLDDFLCGNVNPEDHPQMVLEVVETNGRFYSNNNRKLKVSQVSWCSTSGFDPERLKKRPLL